MKINFSLMSLVALCFLCFTSLHADHICIDGNLDFSAMEMPPCGTAPVISCPSIYYGCPGDNTDPANTGYATAVPGDGSCENPVVTYTDEIITNGSCYNEIHRVFTATYPNENNPWLFADCTQILALIDNDAPTIGACPSDLTVNMDDNCEGVATWNNPIANDNCGLDSFTSNYASGSTFPEGVTTVIYTATDNCGYSSTCSFNITVQGNCCQVPPVLSCPANVLECPHNFNIDPSVTGNATATPGSTNCDSPITVTYTDMVLTVGNCTNEQKILRNWVAFYTDNPMLSSMCSQIIEFKDDANPVIANCPVNISIDATSAAGAVVTWAAPTATDNCLLSSLTSNHNSGDVFPIGTTTVVYTATDYCNQISQCSFTITIGELPCNQIPIISCPVNAMRCPGPTPVPATEPASTGYATAIAGSSACGDPIVTYSDAIEPMPGCTGSIRIIRTWTATDPNNSSLFSECVQIINRNDPMDPTLVSCPSDIVVNSSNGSGVQVNYTQPVFTDNCGVSSITSNFPSGNVYPVGTTAIIVTATDFCGNTTTCTFNITVTEPLCNVPPVINCPQNISLCPASSISANDDPSLTGTATATPGNANCSAPIVSYSDAVSPMPGCPNSIKITRTWTATDPNNAALSSSCVQIIDHTDNAAPVLVSCVENMSFVTTSPSGIIVLWNEPVFTDNCGIASITATHDSGDAFPVGLTTVTYVATDNCGLQNTCSFTIDVSVPTCVDAPTISCPQNISLCPATGITASDDPSITGTATATAGGSGCNAPSVNYSDVVSPMPGCPNSIRITRTWTATDPTDASLNSSCVQLIDHTDNTAPTVISCVPNINQTTTSPSGIVVTWNEPLFGDDCGIESLVSNIPSGSVFTEGTTTVVYTATDYCGLSTTCSFTVTVNFVGCTSAPSISCPSDITVCPGSSILPANTGQATATAAANCSTPTVSYSDVSSAHPICGQIITRTWTAYDPVFTNYSVQCTQVITMTDNESPFVMSCPANITVVAAGGQSSTAVNWSIPTFNDNCGVAMVTPTHINGDLFPIGTTTVEYLALDACGNHVTCSFNITVEGAPCVDNPIITCPSSLTLCPGSNVDPANTGQATIISGANCNPATLSYNDTETPLTCGKIITRTWTATDPDNAALTASCIQTITMSDTQAPTVVSCSANITQTTTSSTGIVINWNEPVFNDNCGIATVVSTHSSGTIFQPGTTTVTYTATDNCGLTTTCSFTVTVDFIGCTGAPTLTCPADVTICPGTNSDPSSTGQATAIGAANCSTPTVEYTDVESNHPVCGQIITRTWTAYDPVFTNYSVQCTQVITMTDDESPFVMSCPNDIFVTATGSGTGAEVNWFLPTFNDNCGIAMVVPTHINGDLFPIGTTTVEYLALDGCGNSTTCSFNITVDGVPCVDNPIISCPQSLALCPGSNIDPAFTGQATATSGANCNTPIVTYNDTETALACGKIVTRTWTATDPNNAALSSSCAQIITMEDTQAPTFVSCVPNIEVDGGAGCSVAVNWLDPVVADNCGVQSLSADIPSGSVFTTGTTVVTYTLTDNCGNTNTCSFNVTVTCCGVDAGTLSAVTSGPTCLSNGTGAIQAVSNGDATIPAGFDDLFLLAEGGVIQQIADEPKFVVNIGGVFTVVTLVYDSESFDPSNINLGTTTLADLYALFIPGGGTACGDLDLTGVTFQVVDCAVDLELEKEIDNTTPNVGDVVNFEIVLNNAGPAIATGVEVTDLLPSGYTLVSTSVTAGSYDAGTGIWDVGTLTVNAPDTLFVSAIVNASGNYLNEAQVTRVNETDIDSEEGNGVDTDSDGISVNDPDDEDDGDAAGVTPQTSCTVAPSIVCPDDVWACVGSSYDPASTGYPTVTAGSTDCEAPKVTYSDEVVTSPNCPAGLLITRTWTAEDPNDASLSTSCVQIIEFTDNQPPIFIYCPDDITIDGGPWCDMVATWEAVTATDNCELPDLSSNYASGVLLGEGVTTVVYTATDACGNTSTCSFDVTVVCSTPCNTPPVITCPDDYNGCPGSDISPSAIGYATATSSATCGTPVIEYTDVVLSTASCGSKWMQRIWTASYANNPSLTSSCNQFIELADNVPPVFTYCPADLTVNGGAWCDLPATWNSPVASDNCGAPTVTSNYSSGTNLPEGTTNIVYTATDACGNTTTCSFNITVVCSNPCQSGPVITCPADFVGCPTASISPSDIGFATATAGPNCPTPTIDFVDILMSTGNCNSKWIKRMWTATDPTNPNLTTVCEQFIELDDNEAPEFWDCPSNITIPNYGTTATWITPIATDNCGNATMTSTHNSGDTFAAGTTTVVYTATDACGNSSTCTFTVTVNGTTPPDDGDLTCPDDINLECGPSGGAYVTWNDPVYSGSCGTPCSNGAPIPGFIYMGSYNGSQYYCSNAPAHWMVAQSICSSNGGHLAVINSGAENTYLANILTIQSAYIGLSDHELEGNFQWVNGDPVTFTNWYPGQPNDYNGSQDFVEMLSDGTWNDQYETKQLEFIMEIPCYSSNGSNSNIVQTSGPQKGSYLSAGNYTVTYEINTPCGHSTCSFDINVEAGLSLQCPDDVTLSCPIGSAGIEVNWETPIANTCCSNCSGGNSIPGFIYMGSYNGHYYYCSNAPDTWENASAVCQANGGYLAAISNQGENLFLANQLNTQSAYIGLNDASIEGNFQWSNGEALVYQNWYPNQPNDYNGDQDYVELLSNGEWNDQYSYKALEYIMELPGCVNVIQTGGPASGTILAENTTTTVTYTATDNCGNTETCSFDITIVKSECNSGGTNTTKTWIDRVMFNTLDNYSGNNGGYADFTSMCTGIAPGQTYPIKLIPGFAPTVNTTVYWKVWIDFNMDGDFNDAGEYVAYGSNAGIIQGNVTMPTNLWAGTATMRVVMKAGEYPTGPCEVFEYGETEDYCINIVGGDLQEGDVILNRSNESNTAELFVVEQSKELYHNIMISPNPAVDFLNVRFEEVDMIDNINIMDITGQVVAKTIQIKDKSTVIDLDRLDNGMYLLITNYKNGMIKTDRFVVQR